MTGLISPPQVTLCSHPTCKEEELSDVLRRKGFERYITEEERMEFLSTFVRDGVLVEIVERVATCRDPKDDKFLELAVNGKARCACR